VHVAPNAVDMVNIFRAKIEKGIVAFFCKFYALFVNCNIVFTMLCISDFGTVSRINRRTFQYVLLFVLTNEKHFNAYYLLCRSLVYGNQRLTVDFTRNHHMFYHLVH
jgi:hypothetical protein